MKEIVSILFGIIDTNCDPDLVDYVIPGNDDAVRAIKVVLGVLTNAIIEVKGGTIIDYVTEDDSKKIARQTEKAPKKAEPTKEKKEKVKEVKEVKEEKPVVVPEETIETKLDLTILTVSELRELAKKKAIKGYSRMKKDELINALK